MRDGVKKVNENFCGVDADVALDCDWRVIFSTDPACRKHDAGAGHPEQPGRYDAVLDALKAAGLHSQMREVGPRAVQREDLLLVHEARYLDLAEKEIREGSDQLSTGDTGVGPLSWDAALAA